MTSVSPYKILENVPIPQIKGPGRKKVYPFDDMKVGDCFDVPLSKQSAVAGAISKFRKESGSQANFTRRKLNDLGVVRIWRIA